MATSFDFFRVEQLRSRVRHACLVDPTPSKIVIAPRLRPCFVTKPKLSGAVPYLPHGPFALGDFDPQNTKVKTASALRNAVVPSVLTGSRYLLLPPLSGLFVKTR
jgi:hypothetical protein